MNIEISNLDNDVILKVEDDGNGFPSDILDKLGEPYISKNKKGMGLGLSLIHI